jgi:acetylornithine/succinyldiaminopimelate/putrescine aminotransferase
LEVLLQERVIDSVQEKALLFQQALKHPAIKSVNVFGLWMAVEFDSFETCKKVIDNCITYGVITDWFLFNAKSLRISPPLTISEENIRQACEQIIKACDMLEVK